MKHQKIYNRLRRIEGQIRGIEEMVANDRPEEDILIQLEAAKSSIASTIGSLVEEMLALPDSTKAGSDKFELDLKKIKTLLRAIKRN